MNGLTAHIENVHNGTTYPCSNCDFSANSKMYLLQHIKYRHEQLAYRCESCDYYSDSSVRLRLHIDRIHIVYEYNAHLKIVMLNSLIKLYLLNM